MISYTMARPFNPAIRFGNKPKIQTTGTETLELPLQQVKQYYNNIDTNEVDAVIAMFADDATYERTGWDPLKGQEAIAHFYREVRQIRGKHSIASSDIMDGDPNKVFVEGSFSGTKPGKVNPNIPELVDVSFTDEWHFNDDGKVIYRQSIIFTQDQL